MPHIIFRLPKKEYLQNVPPIPDRLKANTIDKGGSSYLINSIELVSKLLLRWRELFGKLAASPNKL